MISELNVKKTINLIEALRRRIQRHDIKLIGRDETELTKLIFHVSDTNRKINTKGEE